ncbi:MAG: DUF2089 domain-containing protein [Spirochaetia bacterium]
MKHRISKCPACGNVHFEVEKIRCTNCGTGIEGSFSQSKLGNLSLENERFAETFLRCRGNIKDVERELGISYPTVRSRLDKVIKALGYAGDDTGKIRREILEALEKEEIKPEEAVKALKDL